MTDFIAGLPPGSRVLDLGAGGGSFTSGRMDVCVVRLDLEAPASVPSGPGAGFYVVADAARMPFPSRCFDLIVSNHSLEHFCELAETVREVGRIVKPQGVFHVAVPDATTLTDRIYRWLAQGGGHVNPFRSPEEVVRLVEELGGLKHRGTRALYSSLSFLNTHNAVAPPPRKIALSGFGNERFLAILLWTLRWLDRRFGTRLSRYGWSFDFANVELRVRTEPWVNVCVRCGSGHSEAFLRKKRVVRYPRLGPATYCCPTCGGFNLLSEDAFSLS